MTDFNYKQRRNTDDYRKGWDQIDWSKKPSREEPPAQPETSGPEGLPEEAEAST